MAFEEDFSVFFGTDEFAIDVVIGGVPLRAIFDGAYDRALVGEIGMASTSPVLRLPTASVALPLSRAEVVINGTPYRIAEHEPDGTGMSVLFLEIFR